MTVYVGRLLFGKDEMGVLGQIACNFISGLLCGSKPTGPDGNLLIHRLISGQDSKGAVSHSQRSAGPALPLFELGQV